MLLADRSHPRNNVNGHTLQFSDGSTVTADPRFPIAAGINEHLIRNKETTTLKVTIDSHDGSNPGLGEIVVIAEDPDFRGHLTGNASIVSGYGGADGGKLFDGDIASDERIYLGTGWQDIYIDLGDRYWVDGLRVWRDHEDGPTYHDLEYKLAPTNFSPGGDLAAATILGVTHPVVTVFETGTSGSPEYKETMAGRAVYFPPVYARYLKLISNGSSTGEQNRLVEVEVYGMKNLAEGITPTTDGDADSASGIGRATDGDIGVANRWELGGGLKYAQLDLGGSQQVDSLRVWRNFADKRRYHDVVFQLSFDATFASGVTTVFNNDLDNSAGLGTGTDGEYDETATGKIVHFAPVRARYVRLYSDGNTRHDTNNYVEIMVGQAPQVQVRNRLPQLTPAEPLITSLNTAVTLDLTTLATDPDNDALTYAVSDPDHGSVSLVVAVVTYTPDTDYYGEDSLTYTVTDARGGSATGTVPVTVNHPPVAQDLTVTTLVNTPISIDVRALVSDPDEPDAADLELRLGLGSSHGTVRFDPNRRAGIIYTPDADFAGEDGFTYTVVDRHDAMASGTITVRVNVPDTTAPTVTFASGATHPTRDAFTVTLTFSESVTGLAASEVEVTNGTAADFGETVTGTTWTVTVTPDANYAGDVTVTVPADAAADAADNGNAAASATFAVDTKAPVLDGAAVDGTALTLTYDETLDAVSVPAGTAFAVTVGGSAADLAASGAVTVSGRTVVLTLAAAVDTTDIVTVTYTAPDTIPVRDALGNAAANLVDRAVDNDTTDTTAPTVTVASDAGFPTKDAFAVRIEFSEAVTGLTLSGIEVTKGTAADLGETVTGTTWTVTVTPDANYAGDVTVTVPADAAADAADNGNAAASATFAVDTRAPVLAATGGAAVNGNTLTLTYDEALDANSVPAGTAFAVRAKAGETDSPRTVALAGTAPVTVSGRAVVLTLAEAVAHGETVAVGYTAPSTNKLRDALGNAAAALTDRAVTNETPDTTAPTVTIASASGASFPTKDPFAVTLTFSEAVTGLAASKVEVTNGTAASSFESSTATVYVIEVTPEANYAGDVTVTVPADAAADAAANGNAAASATFAVDTRAPVLAATGGAAVNGNTLTLTYDEALDTVSVPAASAFAVRAKAGGAGDPVAVNLAASGAVTVSGRTVTLTLAAAVDTTDVVTVTYTAPSTNKLRDALGNAAAALTDRAVTNETPDTTAPTVTIASDADFPTKDAFAVTLTFSEAVTGLAASKVEVTNGTAASSFQSSTATVYVIEVTPDANYDGDVTVAVPADAAEDAADNGNESASATFAVDTRAPVLAATGGAAVNGNTLTLTYDEALDAASTPAGTAFAVRAGPSGSLVTVALANTNPVTVSGTTVTLTLASAVAHGETVTVGYTAPSTNKLRDALGNAAANLAGRAVVNETPDTTVPTVTVASDADFPTKDAFAVRIEFSEAVTGFAASEVDVTNGTAAASFTSETGTVYEIEVTPAADVEGDVTVAVPEDAAADAAANGNESASATFAVDTRAPVLAATGGAAVNGNTLTLTYDEALDAASAPAAGAYRVKAGPSDSLVAVSLANSDPVAVSGAKVTLTLASAVAHGETVTVDYTKPGTDPVRDAVGNAAANLADRAVDNETPDTTAPELSTAVVIGKTLTLTYDEVLDKNSEPAPSVFTVKSNTSPAVTVTKVAVFETTVLLTLGRVVAASEAVTVSYMVPATNPIQDAVGNDAKDLTGEAVTNSTPTGIALSVAPAAVAEDADATAVTVTATLPGTTTLSAPTDVTVSVAGGTATAGTDFVAVADFTVTIPAAASSGAAAFDLAPRDDAIDEPDETLVVSGAAQGFTVAAAQLTLADDDGPTVVSVGAPNGTYIAGDVVPVAVRFSSAVAVSGGPSLTLETGATDRSASYDSGTGTATLRFDYTVEAGDAAADLQYASTAALALNGGAIAAAADNLDAVRTLPALTAATSLAGSSAVVVDTTKSRVFSIAAARGDEGASIAFAVTLARAGQPRAASVDYTVDSLVGDTATAAADYTAVTSAATLSFDADATTATFTVATRQDAIDEDDETFTVTLRNPSAGSAISTTAGTARGTITDDDAAPTSIALSVAPDAIEEDADATAVTVTATLPGTTTLSAPTDVTVSVAGGTATAGTDFVAVADFTVTIPAAASSGAAAFDLAPRDDAIDEPDETLVVSGAAQGFTVAAAQLTLADDDGPTVVSVGAPNGTYIAGDVVPVAVRFSSAVAVSGGPSLTLETGATDRSASYDSGTGTATLRFDYTVEAGDAAADLQYASTAALALNGGAIAAAADNLDAVRTLPALTAATSLAGSSAVVVDTTKSRVFSIAAARGDEGASIAFAVTLARAGQPRAASVDYTVDSLVGDTATAAADYTAVTSAATLSFDADATTATFTVATRQDAIDEDDETFTVTLRNPSAGSAISTTAGTARGTITDDDAAPTSIALSVAPDARRGGRRCHRGDGDGDAAGDDHAVRADRRDGVGGRRHGDGRHGLRGGGRFHGDDPGGGVLGRGGLRPRPARRCDRRAGRDARGVGRGAGLHGGRGATDAGRRRRADGGVGGRAERHLHRRGCGAGGGAVQLGGGRLGRPVADPGDRRDGPLGELRLGHRDGDADASTTPSRRATPPPTCSTRPPPRWR